VAAPFAAAVGYISNGVATQLGEEIEKIVPTLKGSSVDKAADFALTITTHDIGERVLFGIGQQQTLEATSYRAATQYIFMAEFARKFTAAYKEWLKQHPVKHQAKNDAIVGQVTDVIVQPFMQQPTAVATSLAYLALGAIFRIYADVAGKTGAEQIFQSDTLRNEALAVFFGMLFTELGKNHVIALVKDSGEMIGLGAYVGNKDSVEASAFKAGLIAPYAILAAIETIKVPFSAFRALKTLALGH
jgi:hypothetical protein